MSFTRFRIAAVGAALLAVMLSHAAAQQAAPTPPAVIRFPAGAAFEVPQSWSWGELVTSGGVDTVELTYDATGSNDRTKNNPNRLTVQLGMTPSEESWSRIDINQSQTLPNGVSARWKSGARWNIHSWFEGWATAGSKTIRVLASGGLPAKFNSNVLQAAFLKIAGSMREVPRDNAIFHPVAGFSVGREIKNWNVTVLPASIEFRCGICGTDSRVLIYVYPAKKQFNDLSAALADVTAVFVKHDNAKAGELRRASLSEGEILWTEQPDSGWPVAGVLTSDGKMFFVNMTGKLPGSLSVETLRADYMAVAQSVKPWDGR